MPMSRMCSLITGHESTGPCSYIRQPLILFNLDCKCSHQIENLTQASTIQWRNNSKNYDRKWCPGKRRFSNSVARDLAVVVPCSNPTNCSDPVCKLVKERDFEVSVNVWEEKHFNSRFSEIWHNHGKRQAQAQLLPQSGQKRKAAEIAISKQRPGSETEAIAVPWSREKEEQVPGEEGEEEGQGQ